MFIFKNENVGVINPHGLFLKKKKDGGINSRGLFLENFNLVYIERCDVGTIFQPPLHLENCDVGAVF